MKKFLVMKQDNPPHCGAMWVDVANYDTLEHARNEARRITETDKRATRVVTVTVRLDPMTVAREVIG